MSIKRYVAEKDSSISNAFEPNLIYRATGSNMGEADTCEIFSVYSQASASSRELSRALYSFPIDEITDDRSDGLIPASGSVSFYLQLFNAPHSFTVPRKFTLVVDPLTRNWDEGSGVDSDNYQDEGFCNWEAASSGAVAGVTDWTNDGGDFWHATYNPGVTLPYYNVYFDKGYEDLSCDITSLVEEWIDGTQDNYGVLVMLTSSIETAPSSSYTKKFFARGTEYWFKRPVIEARWDDSRKDHRATFYISGAFNSSNANVVYFYNYWRGELADLPFTSQSAWLWTDPVSGTFITASATVGKVATGIYSASFVAYTTASYLYDRWYNGVNDTCFFTGSAIKIKTVQANTVYIAPKYILSMPDLKDEYSTEDEKTLFRVSSIDKNWTPNYYTRVVNDPEVQVVEDLYYQVKRVTDDLPVVIFGTGSVNHTRCSYDASGSYFYLDIGLFEPDYTYAFEFCRKNSAGKFEKMKEKFKFRVVE